MGFSFASRPKGSGWLAAVPAAGRIDLAHVVRAAGSRPEIRMLESFGIEGGRVETLTRLAVAKKLKDFHITTLLPEGQYHLAQFEAPAVPELEWAEALRWKLKDMVDFPVDGASIDVLNIPVDTGSGRQAMVYAVAAGSGVIGSTMQEWGAAKLELAAIDIPELAQRNIAALFEAENRGLAFLHLDEDGGMLTISFRGELYAVRKIEVSARQLVTADPDRRAALLERIMLELQRTLDNFDRQYSFISVTGLTLACCPAVPELQGYLAENLYVPVQPMDLAAVCDFPSIPELRNVERQAQCLLAIGAALRTPEAA